MVEESLMSVQETILKRVREALGKQIPSRDGDSDKPLAVAEVLPPTGKSDAERFELFARYSSELKTDFRLCADQAQAMDALREIARNQEWTRLASHRGDLTDIAVEALALPVCSTSESYAVRELEACDAGITECDLLVAQTGSVVVTSRRSGGRALSVLPPHHVVLARRDQMVPGLPDAFLRLKELHGPDYPSMISFVTGPSRTGDIERILVLGAHGPKQLTVICW